jgi:hypothetical protein
MTAEAVQMGLNPAEVPITTLMSYTETKAHLNPDSDDSDGPGEDTAPWEVS